MPSPSVKTPLDHALRAIRTPLIGVVVFSFFSNLASFALPLYTLQVFTRVLTSQNLTTLSVLTIAAIFVLLVKGLLDHLKAAVLRRCGIEIDAIVAGTLFEAVHRAMVKAPGTIGASAMRNLDHVRDFFSGAGITCLLDLPWFPVFLLALLILHPWLMVLALGGIVVNGVLTFLSARAATADVVHAQEANRNAADRAVSIFSNAEVVQAMGMRGALRALWTRDHSVALAWQARVNDTTGIYANLSGSFRMVISILTYTLVAVLVIQRDLSSGHMLAAMLIIGQALRPIDQLISQWKNLVASWDSYKKLQELFRTYPDQQAEHSLPRPTGRVTFERVNIAAPLPPDTQERPKVILRDINFDLPAGRTLAIIGPSAAGKTSLLKCILGVWKPIFGEIRIDGAEIDHWNDADIGRYFGYLPQEVGLFAGSVSQNIGRFSPDASVDTVQHAAVLARVHEMILTLAKGYNTVLGEGGRGLSGGQRQRIGLARAVYGLPAIVILDEPNSNLDADGEAQLIATLQELKQYGTTVIFVTHKASLLNAADHILVLGEGTVQQYGTREEVQQQFGRTRVVQLQSQTASR